MDIKKMQHLSKRVSQKFQNGDLKSLTIGYGEGFVITSDYAWCEIDLQRIENNVSVYIEGFPLGYALGFAKFEITGRYHQKTKVYEATVSEKEISFLLDKIFFDYDLRLLTDDALREHPAQNVDYITGYVSFDDGVERLWIELEEMDGVIDKIDMDKLSLGGNIFRSILAQCERLSELFIV